MSVQAQGGRAVPLDAWRWDTLAGLPRGAGRVGSAVGAAGSAAGMLPNWRHTSAFAFPIRLSARRCTHRARPHRGWCLRVSGLETSSGHCLADNYGAVSLSPRSLRLGRCALTLARLRRLGLRRWRPRARVSSARTDI